MIHDLVDFEDMRVLEVGCGDGRLTWRYATAAGEVVAIDTNEKRIRAAIEACPLELREKVSFHTADVNSFDLGDDSFDVAVLSYSL